VRGAEGVVFAFGATRETGNAIELTQRAHLVATAGQNLVRIRLMADVPDDAVFRRIENVMQGNRQFDRPQIGRKMAPGLGYRIEHEGAQLGCQRLELQARELPQIGRAVYRIKHTGSCHR